VALPFCRFPEEAPKEFDLFASSHPRLFSVSTTVIRSTQDLFGQEIKFWITRVN
jgi:hypothetical protein